MTIMVMSVVVSYTTYYTIPGVQQRLCCLNVCFCTNNRVIQNESSLFWLWLLQFSANSNTRTNRIMTQEQNKELTNLQSSASFSTQRCHS